LTENTPLSQSDLTVTSFRLGAWGGASWIATSCETWHGNHATLKLNSFSAPRPPFGAFFRRRLRPAIFGRIRLHRRLALLWAFVPLHLFDLVGILWIRRLLVLESADHWLHLAIQIEFDFGWIHRLDRLG